MTFSTLNRTASDVCRLGALVFVRLGELFVRTARRLNDRGEILRARAEVNDPLIPHGKERP